MVLGADLMNGMIEGQFGTVFAIGLSGGNAVVERSCDGGATAAEWIGGGTQRVICAADDSVFPVVRARSTGELVAVIQTETGLAIYESPDRGLTWGLVT